MLSLLLTRCPAPPQELRASLEKQFAQSSQLCVALKHEQTAKDNLQKELQIEASRCEALLAQERGQLSELQRSLEAEKGRSLELAAALRHERLLTEQLSRGPRESPAHHALLRKLKEEKSRAAELQARLEQVQRQQEADVQKRRAELEREKEVRAAQAREPGRCLRREGHASQQQAGLEPLQAGLAAQEGRKDARRADVGPGRADAEMRPTGAKEKLVSARRPRHHPAASRGPGALRRPAVLGSAGVAAAPRSFSGRRGCCGPRGSQVFEQRGAALR